VIKDSDGEVLYAMPGSSPYYKRTDDGLSFERPEGTTTRFSGPLSSGLSIEALYVTLSQEAAFYPIRDAAVVLAALLAALVAWLLVLSNVRPEADARAEEGAESGDRVPGPPPVPADEWAPAVPEIELEESSLYSEDPFDEAAIEPISVRDGAEPLSREPTREPAREPKPAEAPKAAFLSKDDLPDGALEGPRGLFDSESSLGWEAYLRERLSAELRRSASFEQDLSLLIASLDGSKRGDEEFNLFAASVRDFFSFKDMAFLFGDDGAAFILPNMDVDHALRMSEELQKKLSLLFRSRMPGGGSGIHMGLSSRAGRLVDADRIIGEAMAAIGKAKSDGSDSILAFRPDPEKFRAYLAGQ